MTKWIQRIGMAILLLTLAACATPSVNQWPEPIGRLQTGISTSSVPANLPDNVRVVKPVAGTALKRQKFSGVWLGWMCINRQCDAKLAVEKVSIDSATVVYAAASHAGNGQFIQRTQAKFIGNEMIVPLRTGSKLIARLRNDSEMEVMLRRGARVVSFGVLTNTPFSYRRIDERVPTPFTRDDKTILLELVRFRPNGKGPFPTVVMNHGSTGFDAVGLTWVSPILVDFFTERGWQVVFPQRRGRGRSDGVYDEGYDERRTQYSCESKVSNAGMDRAIADTKAVFDHLRSETDVDKNRILISGVSRGAILSIAFAGQFPDAVVGALNFVGGWMNEQCENVAQINPVLFERGAKSPKPTLWLYGENDPFYSIAHSRTSFNRFEAAGGNGKFHAYKVPFGSGHWLHRFPRLWTNTVDAYLREIQ